MASARGMPGSHIPTCPAALQLVCYRQGYRHEIFLAFDILGNRVVGLDIGRQWSGWHGQWDPWNLGGLMIWMSYTGVNDLTRPHFFERVTSFIKVGRSECSPAWSPGLISCRSSTWSQPHSSRGWREHRCGTSCETPGATRAGRHGGRTQICWPPLRWATDLSGSPLAAIAASGQP